MAKPSCTNCTHYNHAYGECWANPPMAQMGMRMNPLTGKPEECKFTYFPSPQKSFINEIKCGAYSPRLEVAQ